jgi:hypothetical protein
MVSHGSLHRPYYEELTESWLVSLNSVPNPMHAHPLEGPSALAFLGGTYHCYQSQPTFSRRDGMQRSQETAICLFESLRNIVVSAIDTLLTSVYGL